FRGLRRFLFENWDTRALVSEDAFYFFAIQAAIGRLDDPFTYFLSPRDVAEMKIDRTQELGGLGMQVEKGKNGLVVIAPIEGTPAFEAGILAGDVIVRVGDETTRDMPLETAIGKLRGEPGTEVTFTIQRPGTPEPIVMTLTRAIFKIRSIKARMLRDGIGYIRLVSFMGEKVAEEFEAALSGLEKDGARALVIDLRSNPGGLMTTALAITDLFVEDGLIFEVRARVPQLSERHEAKREGTHPHVPIVVLVNGGSASASEIVAGILQSKGLATVVGEKTFGKGSVQRVLPLGGAEGPAIGLTIALYYLLGERPVHKIGIEPDIVVEVTPEQEAALARQSIYSSGEEKIEDPRLEKAIEILKAKLEGK
ncbi:MAG: S41 family peptidase, partial [Planctomycetes bacterium]|nr:S41 family peptidase [Planctomycetota bacterium]